MSLNKSLIERDLAVLWHPCTQMKDHESLPLIPIKRGYGSYLEDFDGNKYLDAISSWWVNLFGHSNPYINSKLIEQVQNLEHVLLAGFSHENAIRLAERLIKIAPKNLTKVFYADNGSSGIEVALKMSFHFHKNRGEIKPLFISLENSYHGETMGALSVGDVSLYKEVYNEIIIKSIQTPVPKDQRLESIYEPLQKLKELLEKHKNNVSAIILEPIVQCAGSMHMYNSEYIKEVKKLTEEYKIHLIFDEVATGFGRTGKMFASEYAEVSPDFMVLSKGLTGGYLPLSAVLLTDDIYREFYCDYGSGKSFLHSHSYTGNPLACAVANASLDIFENENILEIIQPKIKLLTELLEKFKNLKNVYNVRQTGLIGAIELKNYKLEDRIGLKVYKYGLEHGVLLRPLGNIIYFMPPLSISESEIHEMVQVGFDAISSLNK